MLDLLHVGSFCIRTSRTHLPQTVTLGFLIPFLLSFFLRRSTTRILNRFSGDIEVIDNELGSAMAQVFSSLMNVIGALIAIVAATNGTFAPVAVPIIIGTRKSRTRESREHAVQMGIVWM